MWNVLTDMLLIELVSSLILQHYAEDTYVNATTHY